MFGFDLYCSTVHILYGIHSKERIDCRTSVIIDNLYQLLFHTVVMAACMNGIDLCNADCLVHI